MNKNNQSILWKVFNFLASLKLAVILLVFFAAMLSWATFYESSTSTEEAQRLIYKTQWFDFFLFLLGLNVACSALSRLPWKKHHTGFVLTHTGIIIILIGSLITRKYGIEGTLRLQEGESASHIRLGEIALSVSVPRLNVRENFDPWFVEGGIPKNKEIRYQIGETDLVCYVDNYYFNPRTVEHVSKADEGNPAVQIAFSQTGDSRSVQPHWLMAGNTDRNALDLGMAKVVFRQIESEEELQKQLSPPKKKEMSTKTEGELFLKNEKGEVVQTIPVEDFKTMPYTFEHNDEQYVVKFVEFFSRAVIQKGKLVNKENGKMNPALRFELHGPEGPEVHLAFSLFPKLGSMHGGSESASGLQGQFVYPMNESSNFSNEVVILDGPEDNLYYRATNISGKFSSGEVNVGETFETTWPNVLLGVLQYYPHANTTQEIVDAGRSGMQRHSNPMVHVRLENNGESDRGYVRFNSSSRLKAGGEECIVEFGNKRFPLGFKIELIDFDAPVYPGTNRPARFESEVFLIDPEKNLKEKRKIFMNNPLGYNNFLVYQSSYEKGRGGQPDVSIFSVARAPGTSTIYVGSIVLVSGMIIMFVSKSALFKQPPDEDSYAEGELH